MSSGVPLTNILQRIERSLYIAIIGELAEKGYSINPGEELTVTPISATSTTYLLPGDLREYFKQGYQFEVVATGPNRGVQTVTIDSTLSSGNTVVTIALVRNPILTNEVISYLKYPNTPFGKTEYTNDLEAISTNMKFSVEVFNNSDSDTKGLMKVPRVVIVPRRRLPGNLGAFGVSNLTPIYGAPPSPSVQPPIVNYQKSTPPARTFDLEYDIAIITNKSYQNRIITEIIGLAIPVLGYLDVYDSASTQERICIEQFGYINSGMRDKGVVEEVISIRILDIFLVPEAVSTTIISPLQQLAIDIYLDNDIPNQFNRVIID
jgi:hypothetical protein